MQNHAGEFVDLYMPRKCCASNRIIGAKDHASIQMNMAEEDKVTGAPLLQNPSKVSPISMHPSRFCMFYCKSPSKTAFSVSLGPTTNDYTVTV
uniref:40S ribosomal protein S21 n=1 Tax=Urocitellus parryii TaxID=9999 RepID=A0A8D2HYD1_UROPR